MECPFAEADYKLLYKQDAKTEPKTGWTIRMKEMPECHTIVDRRLLATFPDEGFSAWSLTIRRDGHTHLVTAYIAIS